MVSDTVRRPTVARVDVSALIHNVRVVRRAVGGRRIMAVVKANAYGHGLVEASQVFASAGVDAVGVAFLEEGIELRKAGLRLPILVLGGIIGNQVHHFLEYDLDLTAASPFKVQQIQAAAAALGRRARVHLKLDTGMRRIGMRWENAAQLIDAARKADCIDIVGVFSHLSESESADPSFTTLQLDRFQAALDSSELPRGVVHHLANSGAVFGHPGSHYQMVRPGLALYGYGRGHGLRPALSLLTRVVFFKVLEVGASVSYDRTWTAPERTRLATLPVGYGDGYARSVSNRAEVLIRGRRYPVVGNVTMDATMVNLGPDGTAYNGDEAVLLGPQGQDCIQLEELAEWSDTIPYETLTRISARVPRFYVDAKGREVQPAALTTGAGAPTIRCQ